MSMRLMLPTGASGLRRQPAVDDMLGSIADDRQMIEACFFSDLFNLFSTINTRSMPVEAVAAMQDEKLLQLGPVLERLNDEFLDPFVDRTFNIMARRNLFPEPPEELQGTPLKVEYVSILAQAQKSIGSTALSALLALLGILQKPILRRSTNSISTRRLTSTEICSASRPRSLTPMMRCKPRANSVLKWSNSSR
jgi:hypothetical protein